MAMNEKEQVPSNLDPDTRVLRDDELECVTGGKVEHSDFVFVHKIDKASPILFQA
jgi:type VI protein secretion system component Hcp